VCSLLWRFCEGYRDEPCVRLLERGSFIRTTQKLLNGGQCLSLRCISVLVDIDRPVDSGLLLIYKIADCHCVNAIEPKVAVVAGANVNKISGFASSVRRDTVLLAWTGVGNTLALKNSNAFKVKIRDSHS